VLAVEVLVGKAALIAAPVPESLPALPALPKSLLAVLFVDTPFMVIFKPTLLRSAPEAVRREAKISKSVPSCGIEVNSIEAAAVARVLDSISFIY
jgi:hypothetical protein